MLTNHVWMMEIPDIAQMLNEKYHNIPSFSSLVTTDRRHRVPRVTTRLPTLGYNQPTSDCHHLLYKPLREPTLLLCVTSILLPRLIHQDNYPTASWTANLKPCSNHLPSANFTQGNYQR